VAVARAKVVKSGGKERFGRGFSRRELAKAGLTIADALRLGVPVDLRRRTVHDGNVDVVKAFFEEKKAGLKRGKPRGKSKS
jgi:ribosomal protein L13E